MSQPGPDGRIRRRVLLAGLLPVLPLAAHAPARGAEVPVLTLPQAAARLVGGGQVMMMRHASTVAGTGDPPGYRLDDCGTQRNLSEQGRAQASAIGQALRAAGVVIDTVRSSQWCRCRDTAQLAFGRYETWPALNSFFDSPTEQASHTGLVHTLARVVRGPGHAMLVTHQVNITAISGVYPAPGQIVVLRPQGDVLQAVFTFNPLAV